MKESSYSAFFNSAEEVLIYVHLSPNFKILTRAFDDEILAQGFKLKNVRYVINHDLQDSVMLDVNDKNERYNNLDVRLKEVARTFLDSQQAFVNR